ncbi:MAG: hypothetical protein EHM24_22690 [Acidobacteria bacterium]|nr:MAG: hypothetical protein EHM24_22690 [Acidobacteriota bacterium]
MPPSTPSTPSATKTPAAVPAATLRIRASISLFVFQGGRGRAEGGDLAAGAVPILLPPAVPACRLPPAACRLPPAACRLPPTAYRLPPAACRLPPAGRVSILVLSCRL